MISFIFYKLVFPDTCIKSLFQIDVCFTIISNFLDVTVEYIWLWWKNEEYWQINKSYSFFSHSVKRKYINYRNLNEFSDIWNSCIGSFPFKLWNCFLAAVVWMKVTPVHVFSSIPKTGNAAAKFLISFANKHHQLTATLKKTFYTKSNCLKIVSLRGNSLQTAVQTKDETCMHASSLSSLRVYILRIV